MEIKTNTRELKVLTKKLGKMKTGVRGATARALNRAAQRTHTAIMREASKDLGVTQKRIKRRVRHQRRDQASEQRQRSQVFLVISDAPVSWLGKPKQTPKGVRVRGRMYERAFVAKVGQHTGVFRRKQMGHGTMSARQYQAIMMRGMTRESRNYRYPLQEIKGTIRVLVKHIADDAIERVGEVEFRKRLVHELGRMYKTT